MILLKLFLEFFKVSCFAFGGAYGAIPLIRDMVLGNEWLTEESLSYMIAVSESTPGPIIVNLATYIGSSQAGILGSLVATTAVVLPAYFVIILVMSILKNLLQNKYVQAVLGGLKPCVSGVVFGTGAYMVIHNCLPGLFSGAPDIRATVITLILVAAIFLFKKLWKKKLSPITLICISAGLGMIIYGL